MKGIFELTGTKLQEQMLHSEAARRINHKDVVNTVLAAGRIRKYSIRIASESGLETNTLALFSLN